MSAFTVVSIILAFDRPLPDGAEQTEALDEGKGGDFCNFRWINQKKSSKIYPKSIGLKSFQTVDLLELWDKDILNFGPAKSRNIRQSSNFPSSINSPLPLQLSCRHPNGSDFF